MLFMHKKNNWLKSAVHTQKWLEAIFLHEQQILASNFSCMNTIFYFASHCFVWTTDSSQSGPDVSIQVNETDIPVGSQAAISCTMVSSLGIVSVNWTLDDTSIDLSKAKYEGTFSVKHSKCRITLKSKNIGDSLRY
jgi:hypothetical protein